MQPAITEIRQLTNFHSDLQEMSRVWSWFLSISPVRGMAMIIYKAYVLFIAIPMFYVYLNGPSLGGFSPFWTGKSLPDICSSITKVDSKFWENSDEQV